MTDNLKRIQENLRNTLTKGVITNYGIFSHFDAEGFAHFDSNGKKNWVGPLALHFVQVKKEK